MSAARHIFVSYSRGDTETVDRIVAALRDAGYSIWIDRKSIIGSALWRRELATAIREAEVVMVALSPRSTASKNVRKELDLTDTYERPVIPVRIAETSIPADLEFSLAGIQIINWYQLSSFEGGIEELRRSLDNLNISRNGDVTVPSSPEAASWRTPPAILGTSAVLASIGIYVMAWLGSPGPNIAAPPAALMSTSELGIGGGEASGFGLIALLTGLGVLFGRSKSLRPAISGLAAFLSLAVSMAIWKQQYFAAALGIVASAAVCAWWTWKSRMGIARRALITHAGVLLSAVLIGGAVQFLPVLRPSTESIIGMAPFEVVEDNDLKSKQADHSNRLRLKLSAVFSGVGLDVVPAKFDAGSIDEWNFDNWRAYRAKEVAPRLLLRTVLNRCGASLPSIAAGPESYVWLAEPYGSDLVALPDVVRAKGSDTRILSLRVAFKLLSTAPLSDDLTLTQQQLPRRVIVDEIRNVAIGKNMMDEANQAVELLHHPKIEDGEIRELLDRLDPDESTCDDAATKNRKAFGANVTSYPTTASPKFAMRTGL